MIFYFIISVATVIYFILFFSLKKYQSYHSIEIKKIITLSYNPLFDFFRYHFTSHRRHRSSWRCRRKNHRLDFCVRSDSAEDMVSNYRIQILKKHSFHIENMCYRVHVDSLVEVKNFRTSMHLKDMLG